MRQWYCFVGGRQYGPVSEDELRGWIQQGRVRPADMVWTEGMGQWAAAGSVPGLFDGAGGIPIQTAGVHVSSPGGTGGRTPNAELNLQARETLRGRWGLAIGFCLLLILIQMGIQMLPYVGGIAGLILTGPLQLGAIIFFLTFIRAGRAEIGMLFAGFRNFGSALAAYLLVALFVALWISAPLLGGALIGLAIGAVFGGISGNPGEGLAAGALVGLIIGYVFGLVLGILAQMSYFQTFYLLADNPSIGAIGAIRTSKDIMRGYKGKLFCLGLRYFCWGLLCILTLGIGLIFLMPYMSVGYARFYDDLQPPVGETPTLNKS
ncbi:MAG: DUF975 family protein [Planctomycetota bacterium]|nr:DUF975 family protein [Planctomycetota bacterium]